MNEWCMFPHRASSQRAVVGVTWGGQPHPQQLDGPDSDIPVGSAHTCSSSVRYDKPLEIRFPTCPLDLPTHATPRSDPTIRWRSDSRHARWICPYVQLLGPIRHAGWICPYVQLLDRIRHAVGGPIPDMPVGSAHTCSSSIRSDMPLEVRFPTC